MLVCLCLQRSIIKGIQILRTSVFPMDFVETPTIHGPCFFPPGGILSQVLTQVAVILRKQAGPWPESLGPSPCTMSPLYAITPTSPCLC